MKKLILFLVLALASPAWAGVAFVNSQQKAGGTTGTNGSGVFVATAGNIQLVFATFYNGAGNTPHVSSITNCNSDTYTQLGILQASNSVFIEAWGATFSASNASCTTTVTSTPTGTGTSIALEFDQYSCAGCSGFVFNTSNVTSNSGASATSGSITITTSHANNWVAGAFADHPAIAITSGGFSTARGSATTNGGGTAEEYEGDDTTNAAAPVTVDWSTSSAVSWAGIAVELCTTSPCVSGGGGGSSVIRHSVTTQ